MPQCEPPPFDFAHFWEDILLKSGPLTARARSPDDGTIQVHHGLLNDYGIDIVCSTATAT